MVESSYHSSYTSPKEDGTDYKDSVLEQYKKAYITNRRIIWACILLAALAASLYAYLDYKKPSSRYLLLPPAWQIEGKMACDTAGRIIVISTFNTNKDSNTRRILLSRDGGMHFEIKGGPWDSCSRGLVFLNIAADNRSFIAADSTSIFLKDSTLAGTFTQIKADRIRPIGMSWVPGTDSVYIYGEKSLIALNYKKPDSLVEYGFNITSKVLSLAVGNKPQGSFRAIVNNLVSKSIQYLSLSYISTYSIAQYNEINHSAFNNLDATPILNDTAKFLVDSAAAK